MKKIYSWEPWFFIFFGLFHMHRIWALFDRAAYASFWMGTMNDRGAAYFGIMGLLGILCILGIVTFFRERNSLNSTIQKKFLTGMPFWHTLLASMFDTASPYWNAVWGFFILLGIGVFVLGIKLLSLRKQQHQ